MTQSSRTFENRPATRERVPLLIGLMGPSGGGKTYSALRLATGIQRVSGGKIFYVDTEARRALHYADRFTFEHVPFAPPFAPLDYLSAIDHCHKQGASVVVVDSMSHEHEGPGGVLEMHDRLTEELAKKWKTSPENANMAAWKEPKFQRRRLINTMLQYPCNFILCFRAKEKVKVASKKERAAGEDAIKQMGFMPIAGEEFVFEMTVNCLLLPGAGGIPTWHSDEVGERMMIKLPEQFRTLLLERKTPLAEELGEAMARWASGETKDPAGEVRRAIQDAETLDVLQEVRSRLEELKEQKLVPANVWNPLWTAWKTRRENLTKQTEQAAQYDESIADARAPDEARVQEEPGAAG